jgi:cytochrome c oxidase subunit 4
MAESAHAHEEEHHGAGRYWMTFITLLVLTGATWYFAHRNLGPWQFPVAVFIAILKASMVVLFFMHLIDQKGANRLVFAVAIIFVLVLIAFVYSDILTRGVLALPPGSFT